MSSARVLGSLTPLALVALLALAPSGSAWARSHSGPVIVADPDAALPGATVRLSIPAGCLGPATVTSAVFAAPVRLAARLASSPAAPVPVDVPVSSTARGGTTVLAGTCADGVLARGALRILMPGHLGPVHAGGGWGATLQSSRMKARALAAEALVLLCAVLGTALAARRRGSTDPGHGGGSRNGSADHG